MKSYFERLVEWMIVVFFSCFCLVMLAEVIGRSVFHHSFVWGEEFTRFSFIWMTLLSSAIALTKKAHVGFDLILDKLPKRLKYIIHILNDILVGIFLVVLFLKGLDLMKSSGMTPSPSMHIPMALVYIILPLSSLITFIFLLESLWKTIRHGMQVDSGHGHIH